MPFGLHSAHLPERDITYTEGVIIQGPTLHQFIQHRLPHPTPTVDRVTLGSTPHRDAAALWRDFGINPLAMARRVTVELPAPGGSPLIGGKSAQSMVVQSLHDQLEPVVKGVSNLASLKQDLARVGRSFGVEITYLTGTPTVNWSSPGHLEVRESGGPAAFHELVHVLQCTVGAGAALGTRAAENFARQTGRQPSNIQELQPYLAALTPQDREAAFQEIVNPLEHQAYSRFEQSAFHVTGMFGRKSSDLELYRTRLGETLDAFSQAYATATVPQLETGLDAKIYGGIGHVARTHGETALVLAGAGLAYAKVARAAIGVHPLMAIPMAAPLGYVLYRALVSG